MFWILCFGVGWGLALSPAAPIHAQTADLWPEEPLSGATTLSGHALNGDTEVLTPTGIVDEQEFSQNFSGTTELTDFNAITPAAGESTAPETPAGQGEEASERHDLQLFEPSEEPWLAP